MSTVVERIFTIVNEEEIPVRSQNRLLSEICGISPQAVKGWRDKPTTEVNYKNQAAIARHFQISLDWLATGRGRMRASDPAFENEKLSNELIGSDVRQLVGQLSQPARRDFLAALSQEMSAKDAAWAATLFSSRAQQILEEDGA